MNFFLLLLAFRKQNDKEYTNVRKNIFSISKKGSKNTFIENVEGKMSL